MHFRTLFVVSKYLAIQSGYRIHERQLYNLGLQFFYPHDTSRIDYYDEEANRISLLTFQDTHHQNEKTLQNEKLNKVFAWSCLILRMLQHLQKGGICYTCILQSARTIYLTYL